jgi:hypothetical protein
MGGNKLNATPWVGREQRELVLSRADRSLHNARAEWRGQFCAVFVLQCRQREPAAGSCLACNPNRTDPFRIGAGVVESRHYLTLEINRDRRVCLGEGLHAHAQPGIINPARSYVNVDKYQPVGRQFGNYYARSVGRSH